MRFGSIFLLGISFLDDASQLCHAVHSCLPDPGQNGGEMGSWLLGEQSLKSSGPRVFRKVSSHTWLSPRHLTVTPARLGFGKEEKEAARPPPCRASPTHSPRPSCCFLSR